VGDGEDFLPDADGRLGDGNQMVALGIEGTVVGLVFEVCICFLKNASVA